MSSIALYKTCATCGIEKSISEFNLRPHKSTYESDCKLCQKDKMIAESMETNIEDIRRTKEVTSHLADTLTPLTSPFPEKITNKTTRKIRV